MTPELSIVVPTWNRRATLEHVLPTLASQSVPPETYEILLCDGDSTDGSAAYVAAQRLPHVRWLAHAGDSRARARNAGIAAARGAIVLFTDADILADRRLVEMHLAAHAHRPGAAIVGWEAPVDSLDEYDAARRDVRCRRRLHPAWTRRLSWIFFVTGNASARREALLRVGGFDEAFCAYGHEDLELGYRLQHAGVRAWYEPSAVNYHWHPHTLEERLAKMEASGAATVRCYRKHRDAAILWRMGVHPLSWGLHALVTARAGWAARLRTAAPHSPRARALALQMAYLAGVKAAWRAAEDRA